MSAADRTPSLTLPRFAGEGIGERAPSIPSPAERGRVREGASSIPTYAEQGRLGEGAPQALLLDATPRARLGLKGPRAAIWLEQHGCDVPALANSWRAIRAQQGSLIARLGSTEFFLEQARADEFFEEVTNALRAPIEGVYPVLREDRAFILSGSDAEHVLAQVCNVDFNRVSRSERHVVMTMMVGVAVLVIPDEAEAGNDAREANAGCYRIWCDPSYGDYLWSSLQDVVRGA